MDRLKKQFFKIKSELKEKKPFFERKIKRWEKRKKASLYKQAKLLLNEAEQCEREIAEVFSDSDWKYNRAFLKVKMQALGGLLYELEAMSVATWFKWVKATFIVILIVFVLRNFVFGVYHVPTSSAEPTLLVGDRVWGNKAVYLFDDPKIGDIVMFNDPKFKSSAVEGDTLDSLVKRLWERYVGLEVRALGLNRGPQNMAKRVIAGPGDVIEGRIEGGVPVLYRNGKKLREKYVNTYPLLALRKETGLVESEKIWGITVPDLLRKKKKLVLYSYNPKLDFDRQPFYFIDYKNVLYDCNDGYMKTYKAQVPATSKEGKLIDLFGPVIVPEGKYWVMGDNRINSVDSRKWGFVDKKNILGRADFIIWSLDSEEPFWLFEFIKNPFRFFSLLRMNRFLKKIT